MSLVHWPLFEQRKTQMVDVMETHFSNRGVTVIVGLATDEEPYNDKWDWLSSWRDNLVVLNALVGRKQKLLPHISAARTLHFFPAVI